jgi:hypothetical protein
VDAYVYTSSEIWYSPDEEPQLTQHAVTSANGSFSLLPSPGATLAVVKRPGLATAWKTWSSLHENSSDPVVLTAPSPLAGIVLDEHNRPVAGAEVWVTEAIIDNQFGPKAFENRLFGKPARKCFSTKTGADGRFRIPNFPAAGHAGLAVTIAGKAQCPFRGVDTSLSCLYQSGNEDIQLRVGPAGAVEGKVVAAGTGKPLAAVKIQLEVHSGNVYGSRFREPVESGADGSFRIPDVQPGVYYVMASIPAEPVPDWVAPVVKTDYALVTVVAGETARAAPVQVSKGALAQVSVVMTNDLTPVAGVPVSAAGSTAYTDANGMVLFRVPVGTNYFSARKDWMRQRIEADIKAGHTTRVQIQLLPPPTITGIVRDPSGAPAAGALVSFKPGSYPDAPDYSEVTTDKHGRYEIILKVSREYMEWTGIVNVTNCIVARDLERNLVAVQAFVDFPAKLDLDLQPGITFSGSVKDTQGAPITNASVVLSFYHDRPFFSWRPRPAKINAEGSFSFSAIPQGGKYYSANVTAKGYAAAGAAPETPKTATNHFDFPPIVLQRTNR